MGCPASVGVRLGDRVGIYYKVDYAILGFAPDPTSLRDVPLWLRNGPFADAESVRMSGSVHVHADQP